MISSSVIPIGLCKQNSPHDVYFAAYFSGHRQFANERSSKDPLTFHTTHSEHIRIFSNGRIARRVESFCKGICFSARPVSVGEVVLIKCSDVSFG